MDREQQTLLDRILAFEIDERPKTLSFPNRLARENGWSVPFARRVIDEYKRFVFLCMEAGHPCTPSDQVDQAWHLHLTYTKSYWERLNGEILPRPLHHNPTEGGRQEDAKFDDWYARTKESYIRFFGQVPPADIWPPVDVRFGDDVAYERINTRRNWILPKRRVRFAGAGILGAAILAGCGATGNLPAGIIAFFVFGGLLLIGLIIVALSQANRGGGRRGDQTTGSGCGGACGGGGSGSDSGHHDGHSGCGSHGGSSDGGSSGCGGGGCGGGCGGGD